MSLSSAIALIYSLLNRLSAVLLLRVVSYSLANSDERAEGDVDEMLREYMTALMQQSNRQNMRSRSHSSWKLTGGEGLPRLIVPLVIDEIFETDNEATDSMLLHPIGDNQISIATFQTHDQIVRGDLDLQVDGEFRSRFAGVKGNATVSGVVDAILDHCAVDEQRGSTQVFTVQRDRWGRCDAAAEHMVAKLRSISSDKPMQSQAAQRRSANTANTSVRRIPGRTSSLDARLGGSLIQDASSEIHKPLLQNHPEHSGDNSSGKQTDSTIEYCASLGGRTSLKSMLSSSTRSAYQSADTSSLASFKTANDADTVSLNGGEGGGGGSVIDWASARSFSVADEVEDEVEME
jgi:hypothetical protein